jgi:hypothetical protein
MVAKPELRLKRPGKKSHYFYRHVRGNFSSPAVALRALTRCFIVPFVIWGRHIITSPIEHHATLYNVQFLQSLGLIQVSYVELTQDGHIDLVDLEQKLASSKHREDLGKSDACQ